MNKILTIIICDFLILSTLSFAKVESNVDLDSKSISNEIYTKRFSSNVENNRDNNEDINGLKKTIKELNSKISLTEAARNRFKNQIPLLIDKNQKLEGIILKLNSELELTNNDKKELWGSVSRLQKEILTMAQEKQKYKKAAGDLSCDKVELKSKVKAIKTENDNLKNQMPVLKNKNKKLESIVESLNVELKKEDRNKKELLNSVNRLQKKAVDISKEKQKYRSLADVLSHDKSNLKNELIEVEEKLNKSLIAENSLSKKVNELKVDVDRSNVEKQRILLNNKNLIEENTRINFCISNFKKTNRDLECEIKKLKLHHRNIDSVVRNAKRKIFVNIVEEDKYDPNDILDRDIYSLVISIKQKKYLIATASDLGFEWKEILSDGDLKKIDVRSMDLETGNIMQCQNAYLLNGGSRVVLIPVSEYTGETTVLHDDHLFEKFDDLFFFQVKTGYLKTLGRLSTDVDDDYLIFESKYFDRDPNEPKVGDLILTRDGELVGIFVKRESKISNNRLRLKAIILDSKILSNFEKLDFTSTSDFVQTLQDNFI